MKDGVVNDPLHQLPKAGLRLQCAPFGLAPLCHVSRNLYEAQQLAIVTPDGIDYGECPKSRSIFANPPAFAFEASALSSNFQCVIGKTPILILGREKVVELSADHFLRLIPLETSGTGIPAYDLAFGIEQVEGVINYRIDQKLQPTLIWNFFNS
jgi:hypothetical protein